MESLIIRILFESFPNSRDCAAIHTLRVAYEFYGRPELLCYHIRNKNHVKMRMSPVGNRGIKYLIYYIFNHLRDKFLLHGIELL